MTRTEFGYERTNCCCKICVTNCRHMPGFLVPSDLGRMIPDGVDPFKWAETNLLASPGAIAIYRGEPMRISTLVPAVNEDGSCIHLQGKLCDIHEISPFGCAFFDCRSNRSSEPALIAIIYDWLGENSLYRRIWEHLDGLGLRQKPPEELQARMRKG